MPTIRNIPLRHELKYHITPAELGVLRGVLAPVMQRDPNGNEHNEYHIRSLYFDTINDDALEEKIAGVGNRKKYRIRIYNFSDRVIKLECKSKYGDLISKQSVTIPRELADQLIAGDPEGLQRMRHPLFHDVYREMRTRLLRPAVIVDYVREAEKALSDALGRGVKFQGGQKKGRIALEFYSADDREALMDALKKMDMPWKKK